MFNMILVSHGSNTNDNAFLPDRLISDEDFECSFAGRETTHSYTAEEGSISFPRILDGKMMVLENEITSKLLFAHFIIDRRRPIQCHFALVDVVDCSPFF